MGYPASKNVKVSVFLNHSCFVHAPTPCCWDPSDSTAPVFASSATSRVSAPIRARSPRVRYTPTQLSLGASERDFSQKAMRGVKRTKQSVSFAPNVALCHRANLILFLFFLGTLISPDHATHPLIYPPCRGTHIQSLAIVADGLRASTPQFVEIVADLVRNFCLLGSTTPLFRSFHCLFLFLVCSVPLPFLPESLHCLFSSLFCFCIFVTLCMFHLAHSSIHCIPSFLFGCTSFIAFYRRSATPVSCAPTLT
jgi:hypothetical protein